MAISTLLAVAPADAKTKIGCGWIDRWDTYVKPRECFLDWPNLILAGAITLHRTHWKHWGSRVATATAVYKIKDYDPFTPVRVRAFHRQRCRGGFALYTNVRVTFDKGSHVWRTPTCDDAGVGQRP